MLIKGKRKRPCFSLSHDTFRWRGTSDQPPPPPSRPVCIPPPSHLRLATGQDQTATELRAGPFAQTHTGLFSTYYDLQTLLGPFDRPDDIGPLVTPCLTRALLDSKHPPLSPHRYTAGVGWSYFVATNCPELCAIFLMLAPSGDASFLPPPHRKRGHVSSTDE
ncbi:hypothetical protein XA68_16384 [Ophiocordyceps unilateralis]|uniref:Uncharacterized protein n=1 Tax=Ophiocordyceps unilateralis TaxID=268505 RepID=A0A2A9PKL3_OPHUN|nr:hypothetical protein XA68_16384 [Ophiocordyceps unilateralis]